MEQHSDVSPELALELKELSSRDVQLWSIAALVGLIVTIGFITLVAPNLVWRSGPVQVNSRLLPQLFTGFIVLIVLVNIYLLDQRRRLNQTRDRLIRKLMTQEASNSELCDPLTKLFSRHYLELLIPKETARADRDGKTIAFAMVSVSNVKAVATKFGTVAGDHLLLVASQLLKGTLRGSDIICRYGTDDFLLLLPDTSNIQARRAILRLQGAVERWNSSTTFSYKIEAHFGFSTYSKGMRIDDVILAARQNDGAAAANLQMNMASLEISAVN